MAVVARPTVARVTSGSGGSFGSPRQIERLRRIREADAFVAEALQDSEVDLLLRVHEQLVVRTHQEIDDLEVQRTGAKFLEVRALELRRFHRINDLFDEVGN